MSKVIERRAFLGALGLAVVGLAATKADANPSIKVQGPVSYYTGSEKLNPPRLDSWSVAKGFPRKHGNSFTRFLDRFRIKTVF